MPKFVRSKTMCLKVMNKLKDDPTISDKILADEYNCSPSTIRNIRTQGYVVPKKTINTGWLHDAANSETGPAKGGKRK